MFGVKQADNKYLYCNLYWNSYYKSLLAAELFCFKTTNVCLCQILWENGPVKLSYYLVQQQQKNPFDYVDFRIK